MKSTPATDWASLPLMLTVEEARQVLRRGRNAMYEAIREGRIPHVKIGHRLLVPRDRLRQTIEASGCQELAA